MGNTSSSHQHPPAESPSAQSPPVQNPSAQKPPMQSLPAKEPLVQSPPVQSCPAPVLTANGFIKTTTSGTKFIATFSIDDLLYTFSGHLNPAVQMYSSNNATIQYTSVGQLTATRAFSGKIGKNNVTINLNNGPKIVGPLDMPIHPASTVSGDGTWTQN